VKVAYYSPLPPTRSGIADYSALLLPALENRVAVVPIGHQGWLGRSLGPRDVDVRLYHVGNNPDAHGWIVDTLRRKPGVVVLHDFVLHHLVAGLTVGRGNGHGYLDAMEREGGVVGRLLGHGVLDKRIPPLWESRPEDFHLAGEVLDLATGLIVHSRYVEGRARAAGYEGPIWRIPHPAWKVPAVGPAPIEGSPLIGSFGNVNASKRIPQLLEAFAALRRERPDARLLLVGAVSPGFDLDRRLQRLGLSEEGIVREAYVEEKQLWSLMAACDVCVNLRAPTMGETSGSVIRQLSLGKPVVVSDVGWFAELPDSVALKVPVDAGETDALYAALELLARDERARAAMSASALDLVGREHDLDRTAELYVAALEQAVGGEAVAQAVLGDVSRAAAEVGIDAGSPEAAELARRLAEVELGR
jgi:glycosyltransferase involved in cell wall biosynthesis